MLTATQKNAIRKIAKKEFKIPNSTWINIFKVANKHYTISYLTGKYKETERTEMLILR